MDSYILIENFKKYLAEEAITDISDLALYTYNDEVEEEKLIILYNPENILDSLQDGDPDELIPHFVGACLLNYYEGLETMYVNSIYAQKGYGPILYRLAIQASGSRGLAPNQMGQVSQDAKNIWNNFVNGKGREYVNVESLPKNNANIEDFLNVKLTIKEPVNTEIVQKKHEEIMNYTDGSEFWDDMFKEAATTALTSNMSKIYNKY